MAKAKVKSFLQQWGEAFLDTTLIILLVLAVISLIIAGAVEHMQDLSWLDGTAILVTVLIVTRLFHPSTTTFSKSNSTYNLYF